MSMADGSAQGQNSGTGVTTDNGTVESSEVETQPSGQEQEQQTVSNPFLDTVAPEDRPVMEKYIQQWDAGVNRRFQELHQQYRPYKDLGEVEDLQRAVQFATLLQTNPEVIFQALQERFGNQQRPAPGGSPQFQPGNQNLQNGFDYAALPEDLAPLAPAFQQYDQRFEQTNQQLAQVTRTLEVIGKHLLDQQNQGKVSEAEKEFEEYMGLLETEFGPFDREYVVALMQHPQNPMKAEDAIKRYQALVQNNVNESRKPGPTVPAVLGGGGSVSTVERVKPEDLSRKDVRNLVADVLKAAHEG